MSSKEQRLWDMLENIVDEDLYDVSNPGDDKPKIKRADVDLMLILHMLGDGEFIDKINEEDLVKAMSGIDNEAMARYENRKKLAKVAQEYMKKIKPASASRMKSEKAVFRRSK